MKGHSPTDKAMGDRLKHVAMKKRKPDVLTETTAFATITVMSMTLAMEDMELLGAPWEMTCRTCHTRTSSQSGQPALSMPYAVELPTQPATGIFTDPLW